jgi:serine protease Do
MVWAAAAQARSAPESFADLAERLQPAVVNVAAVHAAPERGPTLPEVPHFPPGSPFEDFFREFFERQTRPDAPRPPPRSTGSGFVIDPSGYVVTNNHVIADSDDITIRFSDDTTLKAEVVGRDPKADVALLKVEPEKPLPAIAWGDSDTARVGDWVIAIGSPFNFAGSVTVGIVSAHHRDINVGPYDDFIQTDASINQGNSGGPMFNMDGEVIGINTAILSPSGGSVGLGFAIPSRLARPIIAQLREFGRTRRGWLGVRIQGVTEEIAESLGLEEPRGALVARVTEGQPAEQAGIKAGDIILTFDGKPVDDLRALQRIVAETPVDKSVTATVWRDEREITVEVTVGEMEKFEELAAVEEGVEAGRPESTEMLGLKLSDITPELRELYRLAEDLEGVVITEVAAPSDAAGKGLRAGDVITEVGQEKVSSPRDIEEKVEKARNAGRKSVLLLIQRQGNLEFVPLRVVEG